MTRYSTIDGDMLDLICHRELGSAQHVPAVLEANLGLAALGPVYPAGLIILLPPVSAPWHRAKSACGGAHDTCLSA